MTQCISDKSPESIWDDFENSLIDTDKVE
jgi:hypothetical protein